MLFYSRQLSIVVMWLTILYIKVNILVVKELRNVSDMQSNNIVVNFSYKLLEWYFVSHDLFKSLSWKTTSKKKKLAAYAIFPLSNNH